MADFCKECSIEIFGEDFKDLANINTPEDSDKKLYAYVLCEGCGPILVDHTGTKVPWDAS